MKSGHTDSEQKDLKEQKTVLQKEATEYRGLPGKLGECNGSV